MKNQGNKRKAAVVAIHIMAECHLPKNLPKQIKRKKTKQAQSVNSCTLQEERGCVCVCVIKKQSKEEEEEEENDPKLKQTTVEVQI